MRQNFSGKNFSMQKCVKYGLYFTQFFILLEKQGVVRITQVGVKYGLYFTQIVYLTRESLWPMREALEIRAVHLVDALCWRGARRGGQIGVKRVSSRKAATEYEGRR